MIITQSKEEILKKITYFLIVAFIFTLSFTACDEFFSSSLGSSRTIDPDKIPLMDDLRKGDLAKWKEPAVTKGNPELANALVEKTKKVLGQETLSDKEKADLIDFGVYFAVESSGVGELIFKNAMGQLGNLANADDLEDTLTTILEDIFNDFASSGGPKAANDIAAIAGTGIIFTGGDTPEFGKDYADIAKPGDVAEALIVLVLGELDEIIDLSVKNWDGLLDKISVVGITTETPKMVTVNDQSEEYQKEIALAAYLNLIVTGGPKFDDNPVTSAIRDALIGN